MNTLVTGGFGFVGTHLVEELLTHEPQNNIHIVDNLSTSTLDHEKFLASVGNATPVTYDIADVDDYLAHTDQQFDYVYHLASVVGPAGVLPHAGDIAHTIIDDAHAIADKALEWDARLVNISTSEIYGGGHSAEDDDKVIPAEVTVRLEYAVGKLAAEVALINSSKAHGLDVVNVRPFNIAGPRQSAVGGFVLPRFCEAALNQEDLTVFGTGRQVRAFTHVADMATGIRLAMRRGVTGECYNVGDDRNVTTIGELAQRVINLAGSASTIKLVDPKAIYGELYAEANDKKPKSEKARTELGWRPAHSLDDIILDSLKWELTKPEMQR